MDIGLEADRDMTPEAGVANGDAGHGNAAPSPRKGLSGRTQVAILLASAAVLVGVFVIGPAGLHLVRRQASADDAGAATTATQTGFKPTATQWANLRIVPVKLETFRSVEQADGKIALDDDLTTPVFSPFSGRVVKLFAKAGDHVEADAPLMTIEATEFVQGQNDLITAVATLATARAQLRLSQASERRQHDLFTANAGALKDWQQSQVDLATAQGSFNGAQIALGAVRNRLRILGKSDKEIADLEAATTTQRFSPSSVVVAPISGTVTQRTVGLGQYIVNQSNGGSAAMFSIGDLSRVWLVANVREMDAPLIHLGDAVEVAVSAFPGKLFRAKLVYVAASIDPNTHRLPVRAEIDNAEGALKPEMFASFSIITGQDSSAPAVPASAIVYEGEKAHVFVADPKTRTIEIRDVQIGRGNDGQFQVLAGLKPDEQVVTSGSLFIDRALQGD